jgi:hypothetical protein
MLRLLIVLLLLANGAYLAWSEGWLRAVGLEPVQQSEPQRLGQQVRPEALRILSAAETRRVEAAATPKPVPPECLESGLFDSKQSQQLRSALADVLPASAWTLEPSVMPARWIVYMGKYPNPEAVAKKKDELKAKSVFFEALRNSTLEPGISLGGFDTQARAEQALKDLNRAGVRTAKVVQERTEQRGDLLRLPAVDDRLRPLMDDVKTLLGGKGLRACQ